jgi:hypothetical protein
MAPNTDPDPERERKAIAGTRSCQQCPKGDLSELVDRSTHVLERSGPTASGITDAAILGVPGCEPARGQGICERCDATSLVHAGHEASAMNDYCNWERAFPRRQPKIRNLQVRRTIGDRRCGF